jgi:hypothetical protein
MELLRDTIVPLSISPVEPLNARESVCLGWGKKSIFFQEIVDLIVKKSSFSRFRKIKMKATLGIAVKIFGAEYLTLRYTHIGPLKIMLNHHLGCVF